MAVLETPQTTAQEIEKELNKIGWSVPKQGKCPYLIRVALRFLKNGELPWWIRLLLSLKFGKFKTPSGIEYQGWKVGIKW